MSTSPTVNPLGYQGVRSPNPPAIWFRPRDPDMVTFKDFRNYEIGDLWQNTVSKQFFILSSVATAQGMWDNITGPSTGGIDQLSDDLGNLATPALGIVQIAGGTNIKTTAAGSAVTIDIDGQVSVPNGGTGVGTLTGVVTGNGIAAFTASPVTQYNVLVGAASNAITSIAPTATSGVPLISQGAAADPAFGTAVVAGGGTGVTSLTAYAPVCGGTTGTGAVQAASTGFATAGWVLTSNGNAALPEWKVAPAATGINSIVRRVFTIADTGTNYVPTAGMKYCDVEVVGGGGGGGGGIQNSFAGAGGGGGGYARKIFSSLTIGVSQSLTIGAGGVAGTAPGGGGGAGGTTELGAAPLIRATGGNGGLSVDLGSSGGIGSLGDINTNGSPGLSSLAFRNGAQPTSEGGTGGSSYFGGGGVGSAMGGVGNPGTSYGGGGGGGGSYYPNAGAAGHAGVIVITEYIT